MIKSSIAIAAGIAGELSADVHGVTSHSITYASESNIVAVPNGANQYDVGVSTLSSYLQCFTEDVKNIQSLGEGFENVDNTLTGRFSLSGVK